MAKPEKVAIVADLKKRFEEADATIVTEYRGLTVAQMSQLRRDLGSNSEYVVAKNTLVKRAISEAGIKGLENFFSGPTAVAFIKGEIVDAAKALKKFSADNDKFVFKGGYFEGEELSVDTIKKLADLDSREVLLAKLAGAMQANLAKAAAVFAAPASKVARLSAALQVKKEATEK